MNSGLGSIAPLDDPHEDPRLYPKFGLGGFDPVRVRQGGHAFVYLGYLGGGWPMAIKQLKPEFESVDGLSSQFLAECQKWLALSPHRNVVSAIFAEKRPYEPPYLMLEYQPFSLRDLFLRKTNDRTAIDYLAQGIVEGILHAQSELPGFVHGDLKPENILVDANGEPKISDFGLASAMPRRAETYSASEVAGTLRYMAPELFQGRYQTEASDVYAFGCLMFEAISGTSVFGDSLGELEYIRAHLEQVPPKLYRSSAQYPGASSLRQLVDACLDKNADNRPTFQEILSTLSSATSRPTPMVLGQDEVNQKINQFHGFVNLGFDADALRVAPYLIENGSTEIAFTVYIGLARLHIDSDPEAVEESLRSAEELLESIRDDDRPYLEAQLVGMKGFAALNAGMLEENLALCVRALELQPEQSASWYNVGMAHANLGSHDRALEFVLKALEIADPLEAFLAAMRLLLALKRPKEVLALADYAVRLYPYQGDAYAWRGLGRIHHLDDGVIQISDIESDLVTARNRGADPRTVDVVENILRLLASG